jgi:hypothetical protein
MDVYLVPVGTDRYELYCEVPDEPVIEDGEAADDAGEHQPPGVFRRVVAWPGGFFRRLRARFREMLAEAERERRLGRASSSQDAWLARVKARGMRWVAESIAEQRLLWHLRSQTVACLHYPDDIDEARSISLLQAQLRRDFEKHRFWLAINAVLFVLSGLLFFVPGPNAVAYYFAFRLVGHYLSMRGARQGQSSVEWRAERSAPLAELRRAIALEPTAREQQVQDVALRLRLEHLARFFARTAVPLS